MSITVNLNYPFRHRKAQRARRRRRRMTIDSGFFAVVFVELVSVESMWSRSGER